MSSSGTGIYPMSTSSYECVYPSSYSSSEWVYKASSSSYKCVYISSSSADKWVYFAGCFPKTELIQTDSETVTIGSVKVGDKLLSWDIELNQPSHTVVTEVHKHTVYQIICFNESMRVSPCHPILTVEKQYGVDTYKWKSAADINVGDFIIGQNADHIIVELKREEWIKEGIDVIDISTDKGLPFIVGGFVVRAANAVDNIIWADTLVTQKFLAGLKEVC